MKNALGSRFVANLLLSTAFLSAAHGAAEGRKQIDPSAHPLAKSVVQIGQVGGKTMSVGNGLVVGKDGCHVLTNYHVAFGKGRAKDGSIQLVDKVETGHVVEVGVDLNANTGKFNRTMKARVVEFKNFTRQRGFLKNDLAMLKLDECLGKAYGLARFEMPDKSVKVPQTVLSTLSLTKTSITTTGLFYEAQCVAGATTPIAGLFFQSCETIAGMSGSPVFRTEIDGTYTVVGLSSGLYPTESGGEIPYAIYSSVLKPFVASVLGSELLNP